LQQTKKETAALRGALQEPAARDSQVQTQKEEDQPIVFDFIDWPDREDGSLD